jgi:alpha-1,3-rhamnosyl/mannosyltransferase
MRAVIKVGIDLSPIAFRSRAPGTAVLVEHQARALLAMDVDWEWVVVATPRVLSDSSFFQSFNPIVVHDRPLTYHVCCRLGRIWEKAGCTLGLATAFLTPLIGPPVVTNYFDANVYHPVRNERDFKSKFKSRILQRLSKSSRSRSRALFILSNYGRSQMIAADPLNAHKWVVTPCGCPPVAAPQRAPAWAKKLAGRPFILYAGAFSENKNQRRLIEAWDQLRRRHAQFPFLVLIGPIPADYRRDVIEPAVAKTFQPGEIVRPGFIPEEEVAWAYRNARAYLHPSFAEGFGMPVVQAMSCGVPVACSNSTSLPEVVGDAAILFDPASVESIAAALKQIVFDEKLRTRLKAAGFERSKKFTWGRHAEIVAARIGEELAVLKKRSVDGPAVRP